MITVYTIDNCGPCEKVEEILKAEGYEVEIIPFGLLDKVKKREVADVLRNKGFPAVFKGTVFLGSGIMAVHKVDPDINLVEHLKRGGRNEK